MAVLNLDNYAHFGGLAFGALFGWLFVGASRLAPAKRIAAWVIVLALWGGVVIGACVPFGGSDPMMKAGRAMQAGRMQEALEAADEIIRQAPDRPEGYHLRGDIRILMKQTKEAIEDLKRALDRMEPDDMNRKTLLETLRHLEKKEPDK